MDHANISANREGPVASPAQSLTPNELVYNEPYSIDHRPTFSAEPENDSLRNSEHKYQELLLYPELGYASMTLSEPRYETMQNRKSTLVRMQKQENKASLQPTYVN